jgi:hypothetical protein
MPADNLDKENKVCSAKRTLGLYAYETIVSELGRDSRCIVSPHFGPDLPPTRGESGMQQAHVSLLAFVTASVL